LKNITESQQFKRWFGNSKVVNEDGTPKVVYHGTNKKFTTFKSDNGTYWFSESRDYAEAMAEERGGETVMLAYLTMKNPYYAKLPEGKFSDPAAEKGIIRTAKANKHDGIIIECDTKNELSYDKYYVVFEPTQIKSATDNIGTFDGSNPDINYSLKGTNNTTSDGARKMGASERIAKYAEDGVIPTEVYEELIKKYGATPAGEKPHRDVQVPKKTADNKKVSQTVRTILEAKATPEEALPTIEKMVEDGVFSYDAYTDEKAIKDAEEHLKGNGWSQSFAEWMRDVERGVVSKQHTVMGWALYNNAVNTAAEATSETERKTAMETALSVLDGMIRHQRSAAQALQAIM